MVAAICPGAACPGYGLEVNQEATLQLKGVTSITRDTDLHEGLFYDCSAVSNPLGGYLQNKSYHKRYTAAERAALAGGNLFEGLVVWESDTDREMLYDGTGWIIVREPEVTFTPAFTGVTDGAAVKVGRYERSMGYIDLFASWTFGAGSAVTGPVTLTLPINMRANRTTVLASIEDLDFGTTVYPLIAQWAAVSVLNIAAPNVADAGSIYIEPSNLGAAAPQAAWAAGDRISVAARYPMTTLYS